MGGGASVQQSENSISFHSAVQERSSHRRNNQDEARSYRSKIGAIKLILKNEEHREPFAELVESRGHGAILNTYVLLETLRRDVFEASKSHHLNEHVHIEVPLALAPHMCSKEISSLLEPLYAQVNDPEATYRLWIKTIGRVQESLLALLFEEFETFKQHEAFQSVKMKSPRDTASPRMEQSSPTKLRTTPAVAEAPATEHEPSLEVIRTASIVNTAIASSPPSLAFPMTA
jgi:hypothetical protein